MTLDRLLAHIQRTEIRAKQYALQKLANLIQVAPLTKTDPDGYAESVECLPCETSADHSVRRIQHSGFRSRPPTGSNAVFLLCEGSGIKAIVVAEDDAVRLSIDEGEAILYSPSEKSCKVYMKKDGSIEMSGADIGSGIPGGKITLAADGSISIEAAVGKNLNLNCGAGGFVIVNNGTAPVIRATTPGGDTAGGMYPLAPGATNFLG